MHKEMEVLITCRCSIRPLRTLLGRCDEQNQCRLVLVKPNFLHEGKPSVPVL